MIEPINPSVWRKASRNTAFSVRAVRIASGEYQACPPRVVRGAARQAAIASSLNHTVRLPRWRKPASYAAQFVTLRFCFGMWWRRTALALNGIGDPRSEWGASYSNRSYGTNPRSMQQRPERALRPGAVYRKITNGFRSEWGAKFYADLRSVIETARRRSIRAIDAIRFTLQGTPLPHTE
jgi:hypothetical protein